MRSLFALLVLALPASAGGLTDLGGRPIDDFHVSLRARGWTSNQDSTVQDSEPPVEASVIDLYDDTPLHGSIFIPSAELMFRFDEAAVRFEAWGTADQTRGEFRSSEGFADHVFLQGDRAEVKFKAFEAAGHFEWIPIDLGSEKKIGLEVGLLIGGRGVRLEADFRDSATGEHFRSTVVAGGPDLGLRVTLGFLNCIQVEAWVKGMELHFKNYDYRILDTGAEARLFIDSHFYLGGGFRYNYSSIERGDANDNGSLLEVRYYGPFIVLGLQI